MAGASSIAWNASRGTAGTVPTIETLPAARRAPFPASKRFPRHAGGSSSSRSVGAGSACYRFSVRYLQAVQRSFGMVGIVSAALCFAVRAQAADADVDSCRAAFDDSERILKASKPGEVDLFDARDKLRICAQPVCAEWMRDDCAKSLVALQERIPTVVVTAADASGHDVNDAQVLVDGVVFSARIDPGQHEVRPGLRKFTCVYADGSRVDVPRTFAERQHLSVRCELPLQKAIVAPVGTPSSTPLPSPPTDAAPGSSPLRWIGVGAIGAGVVGLTIGTIFGIKASANKSDAKCDANGACDPGPLGDARSAATVSTIGFVSGGILAVGGILMTVLAPKVQSTVGTLAPWGLGNGAAGVALWRSF